MSSENGNIEIKEVSTEEIEKYFGIIQENQYLDERIEFVNQTNALLNFWHENNNGFHKAKEGYLLAKAWKDEDLAKKYINDGKPFLQRRLTIEEKLKIILPKVKGIRFLRDADLVMLPIWMLELMEIKIVQEEKVGKNGG